MKLTIQFFAPVLFLIAMLTACENGVPSADISAEIRTTEPTPCWIPTATTCVQDFLNCHYVGIRHDQTYLPQEGCSYYTVTLPIVLSAGICSNAEMRAEAVATIDGLIQDFLDDGENNCTNDEATLAPIYFESINSPSGGNIRMTYACCESMVAPF